MVLCRFVVALALLSAANARATEQISIAELNQRAARANRVVTIPDWPQTPEQLAGSMQQAISEANTACDEIARLDSAHVTFENTAVAFDHLCWKAQTAANIAALTRDTTASQPLRDAADQALKMFADWQTRIENRSDAYAQLRRFKSAHPKLSGEDACLVAEQLRHFHRAGTDRYPESAEAIRKLRAELAQLTSEFDANIMHATARLVFTKAELDGMPERFLNTPGIRTTDDQFTIAPNVMWQFSAIEENAKREETRRKVQVAHDNLAKETNVPLLNRMLQLRNEIARRLDYKSWADYRIETQMARNSATAERFVNALAAGLQPKFAAEVSELERLKAAETGDPHAKIAVWDWRYYANERKKQRFAIDEDELRNFFPFERVRDGMLAVYGRVFGVRFDELAAPKKWTDRLQLYVASDSVSGEPLGLLYLDLFTHDGKMNAGGTSEIIAGKRLPDGRSQAPLVAVLLNFAPPTADTPSLLTHDQLEMLFHEFGHALHAIVSRAKYARFAGTNVPRDFVEAPSQMLQRWVWDKRVLDTFAADYRDSTKKIPAETIARMKEAKLATAGLFYRRQCAFAQMDLALHGAHDEEKPYDCVAVSNAILEKTFLPIDRSTAAIASFRGMNGYDAAYYGYAWADAIAADMATVFEKAHDGYLDRSAGMRLRREVYEPGGSRDVNVSVEKFLGRKTSLNAFLTSIGIRKRAP